MISIIKAVLAAMAMLTPVRELTGNRGRFIDAINTWAGSPLGSAWCLNLCLYVLAHLAGGKSKCPVPVNGSCDALLSFAISKGIVFDTPEVGDIFLKINPNNSADATHAGFVDDVLPNAKFQTREGNSNEDGSREGTDVVELVRPLKPGERYKFVRWVMLWKAPT